jgi:hypothetical protein
VPSASEPVIAETIGRLTPEFVQLSSGIIAGKRSRGWLDDTVVGRTAADRGRGCRWSIGVSPLIHADLR